MRFPRIVACLLVTVTVMGQTSGKSGDSAFLKLAGQFVHESLALSPSTASQAGYHKHRHPKSGNQIDLDAELDDIGPTAISEHRRFYQSWRSRFINQRSGDHEDATDLRMIKDQIDLNLLELDRIQNYKHNPTVYVELLGSS